MDSIHGSPSHKLIVVGGGGFAREVIWLARESTLAWQPVGCLDDNEANQGSMLSDVPVVGRIEDWTRHADAFFVVAVGAPRTRRAVVRKMESLGTPRYATLVHRSVAMSAYVRIGEGSMITAGCILTTQIDVGRHVILNLSTTVGHDTVIEDFSTVAPMVAISGNVHLEAGSEVGTGACLRQGIRLGRGAMAGMGAVVVKDVDPGSLVMGSPARVDRQLAEF